MNPDETLVQCQHCGKKYTPFQLTKIQEISEDDYTAESLCTHCQKQNVHNFYEGLFQPEEGEFHDPSIDDANYNNYLLNDEDGHTLPIQPPPVEPQTFRLTDVGNAKRLVSLFGQDIRYSGGGWYYWNGKFWQRDADGMMMRLAKKTAENIFEEAESAQENEKKELINFGNKTENDTRLRAMIKQAVSEEGVFISQDSFDADPWLLNIHKGTLNLKTGQLNKFQRENYITKITPVS
jgi:hypothetical protein